jgi:AcrR family transcriptional regulator
MRTRDDEKQEALFEATIKTVNEVGFAAASVSKIAREASVSPATLYVYYENKEDLLVSAYIEIKKAISRAILENFDPSLPIRDILKNVWHSLFAHISHNREHFQFAEQFANSPYHTLVERERVEKYFQPLLEVVQRGIDQKIIKDVDITILEAFIFFPVFALADPRKCTDFQMTNESVDTAFTLAWDAIKL